jgi:hypothetical protein
MADEREQEDLEINEEEAEKVQGGLSVNAAAQAQDLARLKDVAAEP